MPVIVAKLHPVIIMMRVPENASISSTADAMETEIVSVRKKNVIDVVHEVPNVFFFLYFSWLK